MAKSKRERGHSTARTTECISESQEGTGGQSQALQGKGMRKGLEHRTVRGDEAGGWRVVKGVLHPVCPWLLVLLHRLLWSPGKSPTCSESPFLMPGCPVRVALPTSSLDFQVLSSTTQQTRHFHSSLPLAWPACALPS